MISIIITAYKEPNTIGNCIESIINQKIKEKYELIVICPDKETKEATLKYKKIIHLQDPGKGKPTALNLAFKKAKGKILIFTDGDVYLEDNSINKLLEHFKDKKIGIVSGRPISLNNKNTMLGFWSHLLTDAGAHLTRLEKLRKNKFLVCSGYLIALRNNIIKEIPENSLSDDAVISNLIYLKNYKTSYEPEAKVFVKYPTNFKEWIKQKRRSAGGYLQIKKFTKQNDKMRSFLKESINIHKALLYPKNIKELIWTLILILARLYLWLDILINIKIKNKEFSNIWTRIETTK